MRVARPVVLDKQEQGALERIARGRCLPARLVERARIVLRAAAGQQDQQIAAELGITPEKAARWRNRYLDGGIGALERDAARPGRPRTISETRTAEVIRRTTQEKPFNATHWSTRTMAAATGLSETTVRRIWHANGLKPHLVKTFKISNDPRFAESIADSWFLFPNLFVVLSDDVVAFASGFLQPISIRNGHPAAFHVEHSGLLEHRDQHAHRRPVRAQ